jgi:hypothetical protein
MNKLKIADEAAADIAKAGVVDIRCLEPDATRMMSVLFSFSGFEVAFQGGEGTAKGVERDDAFDQETVSEECRVSI